MLPLKRPAPWALDLSTSLGQLPLALRPPLAASKFYALSLRALVLVTAKTALHLEKSLLPKTSVTHDTVAAPTTNVKSADYLCLLGLADTLSPGTYVRLAGDPDVLENKFVELFESF
jgi:hypothetical protein